MNLQNVKQKLEKVNRFYDYLEANQEIISRIDRDALVASIRALYEACFEEEAASVVHTASEVHKTTPSVNESKETENNKKRPTLVFNTDTTNATSKETSKQTEPKQEPVVEQTVEKTVAKEEPIKQEVTPQKETESTPETTTTDGFNEDFEELFLFKEATDLSQKLSATPLKDLNKALGLNEKFLYINELFGGDVAKFQSVVKVLNEEKDFDTARSYIESQLVETYDWMKKIKRPIAKDFIKLVRRRYL